MINKSGIEGEIDTSMLVRHYTQDIGVCENGLGLKVPAKSNALILSDFGIDYKPKPCVFPVSLRLPFIAET